MPAMEPLYQLLKIKSLHLSPHQLFILEAEIFNSLYQALSTIFKLTFKEYFYLMKFNHDMENDMIEENFIRFIINDLVSTDAYSLAGIATYTHFPEEVIHEAAVGNNKNPSLKLCRKLIELHRSVKPHFYEEVVKKILMKETN
jgi:hypothetical protein